MFEFKNKLGRAFVHLDDDWRTKVTTFISHIRENVKKADIKENLREAIMEKLSDLQKEVDRNRTSFDASIEVFLALTAAAAKGVKNLEPGIKLIGKVIGSLSELGRAVTGQEAQPRLPSPEVLGLSSPDQSDMPSDEPEVKE